MNIIEIMNRTFESIIIKTKELKPEKLEVYIDVVKYHWDGVEEVLNMMGDNHLYTEQKKECVKLIRKYSRLYDETNHIVTCKGEKI